MSLAFYVQHHTSRTHDLHVFLMLAFGSANSTLRFGLDFEPGRPVLVAAIFSVRENGAERAIDEC